MDKKHPRYGPADSLASPRFSGSRTYARLPHVTDLAGVDVAIVGVPFDTGGTYRVGARFGPQAIRAASALIRPYHTGSGVAVFETQSVVDYGDVPAVPGYIEESYNRIEAGLVEVLKAGVIPIDLGGDHSIALPELRALHKIHGPVALVQLDSHSDTIDSYFGMPHTHGTPFYHAVKEGLIDTAHSSQVGLRGGMYSARDHEVPREMGMQVITGVEAHELGMAEVAKRIGEATVRLFVEEGARVVIVARHASGRSDGGTRFVAGDVADKRTARAAVAAAEEWGGVDVLVNNAAMDWTSSVLDTSEDDVRRV